MSDAPVIVKKSERKGMTTQLHEGEYISVTGPATFRIIKTNHYGHAKRSLVNVLADESVKIWKNRGPGEQKASEE